MKKRKVNKLSSNDGVSILLALVVLLVAGMVSVVLLSASTSSIKSVTKSTEALQDGLTLDSASNVLKELIATQEGSSYVANVTTEGDTITNINSWDKEFPTSSVEEISKYVLIGGTAPSGSFTIRVEDVEELKDVQVNYVVNSIQTDSTLYSVIYTLTLQMDDGTESKRYVEFNVSTSDTEYSYQKKVIWTMNSVKGKEN